MATRATTKPRTNGRATHTKVVPMATLAPIELTDEVGDEFGEREPLFSLHGTVYDIPVRVPISDTLRYADVWLEQGITAAVIWALKITLGDEGYRVLTSHRGLTQAQLDKLIGIVRAKFDGSDPKARPATG